MPADWQRALEEDPTYIETFRQRLNTTGNAVAAESRSVKEPLASYARKIHHRNRAALRDSLQDVFPAAYIPTPELNEIYELKLGMLEARLLSEKELIQRGAYFVSINGKPTYHYHLCIGGGLKLPTDSNIRLQSFLGTHQFKTSYATHGLFPYRGKYHPQMIKALMNVMGLHPGSTVLDPMAGSGTTAVEAALMGINSIAIDVSPFCTFMANTKLRALAADISDLKRFLQNAEHLGKIYDKLGEAATATKVQDAAFQPRGISRTAFEFSPLRIWTRGVMSNAAQEKTTVSFSKIY